MSLMRPSELWKMAVEDRVRSESSQKARAKVKAKEKTKRSNPKVYNLYQDYDGPLSEDQLVENPAKIGKVHVETVPVIETRKIHTLLRAPCG